MAADLDRAGFVEGVRSSVFTSSPQDLSSRSTAAVASVSLRSASGRARRGDGETVAQVVVEQAKGHLLETLGGGGHLGEDLDAVRVLVHHPGDGSDLALDAPETSEEVLFAHVVTSRGGYAYPPKVYGQLVGCAWSCRNIRSRVRQIWEVGCWLKHGSERMGATCWSE